jgi:hypothetical protein
VELLESIFNMFLYRFQVSCILGFLTLRFEQLHGIHYIIGTIDESHNHVLAPIIFIIVRKISFNNFTWNCWIKLYIMEL